MKKTTIIYIILAFSLLFASLFAIFPSAQNDEYVIDETGRLDFSEISMLQTCVAKAERSAPFTFRVYVYEEIYASYDGEDYLREFGYRTSDDLVLLILTRYQGSWYYDLYTYGDADRQLSDSEVDAILDAPSVYNNLKSGNLIVGLESFLEICPNYLVNNEINGLNMTERIFTALGIGAAVAFFSALGVYLFYKRKSRSASYPLHEFTNLELTNSQDIFAGDVVTRRYAPRSSSSSGGRSGGRGGGGGHRGGR